MSHSNVTGDNAHLVNMDQEWWCYDKLPRKWRDYLKDYPHDFACWQVYEVYESGISYGDWVRGMEHIKKRNRNEGEWAGFGR